MGRLINTLGIIFLGLSLANTSLANCEEQLAKLTPKPSTPSPSSFPVWSIKEQNLSLKAADLFPEEFVKEVEEKAGPFKILIHHIPHKSAVQIEGFVRYERYMKVMLLEYAKNPQALLVDNLNLKNPLATETDKGLKPDQSGKGLPPQIFRHVRDRLFELAKAGGYSEIRSTSQQHFSVLMLYKKFVGMEPKSPEAKALVDEMESLYSFARKELPKDLKPTDVEEFTRWLGSANTPPSAYTKNRMAVLNHYFQTGLVPESVQIIKNKAGKIICAVFNDGEPAQGKILFFYHFYGYPRVVDWSEIAFSYKIELGKDLN